ncbi:MAG: hypothetical protein EZS28_053144 [Streblomastix strix]|uniref:Uncharacterized protein n=1 Tax=Streblomastix strix TaxID=222440 RepID=A0A5J4RID2_9EUKA|nr:MAG: hypothetical protein EZS28_053144 [Streblomastix strix]
MREVFKYPKDNSVSSLRAAFVEALKTAVNQALDSEVLKGSFQKSRIEPDDQSKCFEGLPEIIEINSQ